MSEFVRSLNLVFENIETKKSMYSHLFIIGSIVFDNTIASEFRTYTSVITYVHCQNASCFTCLFPFRPSFPVILKASLLLAALCHYDSSSNNIIAIMADSNNNNNNNKRMSTNDDDERQRKRREREEKKKTANAMDGQVVGTQRLFADPKAPANKPVEANVSTLFDADASSSSRRQQPLVDPAAISAAITAAAAAVPLPPTDDEDDLLKKRQRGRTS